MKARPKIGTPGEMKFMVGQEHVIDFTTGGMPAVLSTPKLIGLIERTARESLYPFLDENERTVGVEIEIRHLAPTPAGQQVTITTRVIHVETKLVDFQFEVRVEHDCGLNFIDTSPFYGRGMSEVLLGVALKGVPRESYTLCTKLGRYDLSHFDFSAKRVAESVDVSLHRLGTDHIDIMLCHDIEFVEMQQIVDETVPALREIQQQGKVRFIGFSGYPMKIFHFILDQMDVDVVLSYNQYTLQNTRFADEILPLLRLRGVGAMNAGPFSARLLTNAPLPKWLKEPEAVKAAARKAAQLCAARG